jgi:hypothetical protein
MPLLYDIPNNNKPRHTMNEHVNPTIKAILDQFEPLAMAERYKAANLQQSEQSQQERAIIHLIEQAEAFKPIDMIGSEAKNSLLVMLEYIKRWVCKEYTDDDLTQLITIRLKNLAIDLDKIAMEDQQ